MFKTCVMLLSSLALLACGLLETEATPAENAGQAFAQAENLLKQGQTKQAARLLNEATRLDPNNGHYARRLGQVQSSLKIHGQAIMNLSQAAQLLPGDPGPLLDLAKLFEALGKRKKAHEQYAKALDRQGENPEALKGLTRMEIARGQFKEAGKLLIQLRILEPQAISTLSLQAELAEKTGNLEKAEALWRKVNRKKPNDPLILNRLGRVLQKTGKTTEGQMVLRRGVEKAPQNVKLRADLGRALLEAGELDEAEALYREWSKKQPGEGRALLGLSRVQLARGLHGSAMTNAQLAIKAAPKNMEAHLALVEALAANENLKAAIEALRELCRLMPKAAEPHLRLAQLHQKRGQAKEAIGELEIVLMIQPDNLSIRLLLVRLYAQTGTHLGLAKEYMAAALAQFPDDPEILTLKRLVEQAIPAAATSPGDHSQDLFKHRQNLDEIMSKHTGGCRAKYKALREYHKRFANLFSEQRELTRSHFEGLGKRAKYNFVLSQRKQALAFRKVANEFSNFTKSFNKMGAAAAKRGKRGKPNASIFEKFRRKCPRQAKLAKRIITAFNPVIPVPENLIKQMKRDFMSPRFRAQGVKQQFQQRQRQRGLGVKTK